MERGNMTKKEAAILLIDMVSDLRGYGAERGGRRKCQLNTTLE